MKNVQWTLDPTHSNVSFKVKHLMISTVTGAFRVIKGNVETESDQFSHIENLEFQADVNFIDTNNKDRDEHLKSADFFAAKEYRELQFSAQDFDISTGKIEGFIKIKGVERPITLDVDLGGMAVDPYGQTKAGLTFSGAISRKEFGLSWSAVTEAGNVLVGDEVKVNAEVQFIKQD